MYWWKAVLKSNPYMLSVNNTLNTSYMVNLWTTINQCSHTNQFIGYCTQKNAVIMTKFSKSVKTVYTLFCNDKMGDSINAKRIIKWVTQYHTTLDCLTEKGNLIYLRYQKCTSMVKSS